MDKVQASHNKYVVQLVGKKTAETAEQIPI